MEQREIEIFLTLADELHFRRAAERLHVSTARVSQTIKKLEQRIGAPLFERTSRRVELTPIGRRLGEELRPAYQRIQDAIEEAVTAGRGVRGTLRVGFVGAATGKFVLEVAEAFRTEHPDCEVQFHEKQFGAGLGPLRDGEFDMLLATVPVFGAREADLTGGSVLFEEDRLLAVSTGHPFARRSSVSFADLARTTILRTPPTVPATGTTRSSPSTCPTAGPRSAGRRSARSRRCSPSSAPASARIRCRPWRRATTPAPTSHTCPSTTPRPTNGDSSGCPPPRPPRSGPSITPPPPWPRPAGHDACPAPGSAEESVPAELVVDATGRGSRAPVWLEGLGYERPAEDRPKVDVGYASRYLRMAPGAAFEASVMVGPIPGHARGMAFNAVEGGLRLLTVAGIGRANHPPADDEGFVAFADSVAPPDVAAAIRAAEPTSGIAAYRYPAYQRRHYRRLRRFPDGLLVAGDALCSFSPIYAQGMTVAAVEALELRRCLADGRAGLARRYFPAVDRLVHGAWRMGLSSDLALPEVEGKRTRQIRLLNAYMDRLLAAAEHDPVARQFGRVIGLLDAPTSLTRPAILRRVLLARTSARVHKRTTTTAGAVRQVSP